MYDRVWAICEDGPFAGYVTELLANDRELNMYGTGPPAVYRRAGWVTSAKAHRIARFKYAGSLVI